MKSIFFRVLAYTATVTSFVALYSCDKNGSDDPEVPEVEAPSYLAASVPKSELEAVALVNGAYSPLQRLSSSYTFLVESATETTISFEETDDSKDGPQVSIFETVPGNWYPIKIFGYLYVSIGAANLAIESIPFSNLSEDSQDLYIARARFIRGYDYFQLVQLFGEAPLILSADPASATTVRSSIDNVYKQIIEDLTEASEKLPAYDTQKSNPTQLAAKTILAKAYLTWGQKPLSQAEVEAIKTSRADPAKPAVNSEYLQKALAFADEVINSGNYRLLDNFNNIWGVSNENNAEVIFSIRHEGDGIDAQGNHQTHCGFTFPKNARRDPHLSYADKYYETALPDNDKRKAYSYVTSVSYADGTKDTLTWPVSIVRPGKWIHRSTNGLQALDAQPNSIDHIDFRLAEVYLIKAEAAFLLGNTSVALQAINQIRARADVNALTALTQEDLYREWENEFAQEQKHWLNLVRWRTLISTVTTKVPQFEYYKPAYGDLNLFKALPGTDESRFAFYQRVHKHLRAKAANINGHFYRFPIPQNLQRLDSGITPQNPGY